MALQRRYSEGQTKGGKLKRVFSAPEAAAPVAQTTTPTPVDTASRQRQTTPVTLPVGQFRDVRDFPTDFKSDRNVTTDQRASLTGGMRTRDIFGNPKVEIDHVVPLALGGTNVTSNLDVKRDPRSLFEAIFGKNPKQQQGKTALEKQAIADFNAGKITQSQAIAEVLAKHFEIKKGDIKTINYLPSAIKDIAGGAVNKVKSLFAKSANAYQRAEQNRQQNDQTRSPESPMKFTIGDGLDNTQTVLPGPRVSTVEAIKRGEQISVVPPTVENQQKFARPVPTPASRAKEAVQTAVERGAQAPVPNTVRLPGMQRAATLPTGLEYGRLGQAVKVLAEAPVRISNTLKELGVLFTRNPSYTRALEEKRSQLTPREQLNRMQEGSAIETLARNIDSGVHPALAGALAGIDFTLDASILYDVASGPLRAAVDRATKIVVKPADVVKLTWKDVSDITSGSTKAGSAALDAKKLAAFKKASEDGLFKQSGLKSVLERNLQAGNPVTLGDALKDAYTAVRSEGVLEGGARLRRLFSRPAATAEAPVSRALLPAKVETTVARSIVQPGASGGLTVRPYNAPTLYHGANRVVTTVAPKTFARTITINTSQPEILRQLASEGNEQAAKLVANKSGLLPKNFYTRADKIVADAYGGTVDAIVYRNADRPAKGVEVHDLTNGKFYAENKETARAYAMQNRELKLNIKPVGEAKAGAIQAGRGLKKPSTNAGVTSVGKTAELPKALPTIFRGDTTPIKLSEMDTTKVFNPAEKEALSAFTNTPGLYFTDSVSDAKSYGKNLTSVSIEPSAKVINVNDAPKILKRADVEKIIRSNPRIKDWATNWDENFDKAIKQITDSVMSEKDGNEFLKAIWFDGGFAAGDFVNAMRKAGIDGITVPKEGVNHFVIYNKDILKTKSQLTDFYNQANKKSRKPPFGANQAFGALAGIEQDEDGNVTFDPKRAAMGILAGGFLKGGTGKGFKLPEKAKAFAKFIRTGANDLAKADAKAFAKLLPTTKASTSTVKDVFARQLNPETAVKGTQMTRAIKQTQEYQDWAKYAEGFQDKDIFPSVTGLGHASMTMERVAEMLDGGIGGRMYREIVKPVYDKAVVIAREANGIKKEVDAFRVIEGSVADRDASLFAQGKLKEASTKSQALAKYARAKYDELLERLNLARKTIGVEPIPKRQDYITHLNELNVLSELFGGLDRISVSNRISKLKIETLEKEPGISEALAFERAKKIVEGTTGVAKYIDPRQPAFRFAKRRISDHERNPSIIRSLNAYVPSALRYIHQAENVAKNKAWKDVLPANAREFVRVWNAEQVAGRTPKSMFSPQIKRAVTALRGTLGANTILGNVGTTLMQLTSWPQVFATAGSRNTMMGILSRLRSYIPGQTGKFAMSRTAALRNLETDIGLGSSVIDSLLSSISRFEALRNPAANTRHAIDLGRRFLTAIMKQADQFTTGATYEAFYRKAIIDGLEPEKAIDYADVMTGKTQANYFKEALPPLLNTAEGKLVGQFGTYGFNQWEFFKRDFGKEFNYSGASERTKRKFFKQFVTFLTAAYLIDALSEKTFGRQPYEIKSLLDQIKNTATKEDEDLGDVAKAGKETALSYVPFINSVKYQSMPPVFEIGKDLVNAVFADGEKRQKAIDAFKNKWSFNVLLPYGGNQVRKSLEGGEAIGDIDAPFVENRAKTKGGKTRFEITDRLDKAKAYLFGPYQTDAAQEYVKSQAEKQGAKVSAPKKKLKLKVNP